MARNAKAQGYSRAEREKMARADDRAKLARLRESIRTARVVRKERAAQVRGQCKAERAALSERARAERKALSESIARMRAEAKRLCGVRREDVRHETGEAIARAVDALGSERALQKTLKVWAKPATCPVSGRRTTQKERNEESDCEVRGNLSDAGLRAVFDVVRSRIKATARRSRTEAFLEWVHDHPEEAAAIQYAAEEAAVSELIAQEEETRKRLETPGYYSKLSDARLNKAVNAAQLEDEPEPNPARSPGAWVEWLRSGRGPRRAFTYRADSIGGGRAWRDVGTLEARNVDEAARLAVAHVRDHHSDADPFPLVLSVADANHPRAGESYYAPTSDELEPIRWPQNDWSHESAERDAKRRRDELAELRASMKQPKKSAVRKRARAGEAIPF